MSGDNQADQAIFLHMTWDRSLVIDHFSPPTNALAANLFFFDFGLSPLHHDNLEESLTRRPSLDGRPSLDYLCAPQATTRLILARCKAPIAHECGLHDWSQNDLDVRGVIKLPPEAGPFFTVDKAVFLQVFYQFVFPGISQKR
jgi:hypothetical protein